MAGGSGGGAGSSGASAESGGSGSGAGAGQGGASRGGAAAAGAEGGIANASGSGGHAGSDRPGGAGGVGGIGGMGGHAGEGKAITIWIAGDSTVANASNCPIGWGAMLANSFDERVTVTNRAVGGRSVRTWMYNVGTSMDASGECVLATDSSGTPTLQPRWQEMLDGMQSGDYLFIQFGINDGSATCDRHVGIEAFKETYGVLSEAAKARGTQPVFVTPVSAIACNGTSARGTRGGFVDATLEAGVEFDVPVIDLHQLSVDLYNELGFCPIPGGSDVSASTGGEVGAFFCDDHTHFDRTGAERIAELVATAVATQALGLAAYLK
jgi:lysophospholipase L1-like esterase